MPNMTMNRDYVLRTDMGYTIQFKKGKPVSVPPSAVSAAAAVGAVLDDPKDAAVIEERQEAAQNSGYITDPVERKQKLLEAMEVILERNNVGDFTAAGKPKVNVVREESGVRDVDTKESNTVWDEFMKARAEQE